MDEIVALKARLENDTEQYFLTWGRVFDPVDPKELLAAVAAFAARCSLGAAVAEISVCASLRDAATARYLYEAFFKLCRIDPSGKGEYEDWLAMRRSAILEGREIYFIAD